MVLVTDKDRYQVDDTIRLSLYEYAKFSQIARFTPSDLVAKGAPEALFEVIDEGNVDYKVGITDFKKYMHAHFKVASFTWNAQGTGKTMATLDHNTYIKNQIFEMKLIPKDKGTFTIANSRFEYKIYPYEEAFKEELSGPDDLLRNNNRMVVQSNVLDIIVK